MTVSTAIRTPSTGKPRAGNYAVVMGDLVGSESAPSISRLHSAFNEAVQQINKRQKSAIASPLTITLGDEFQGLATSLSHGVAIVRNLRSALQSKKIECRFVIGLAHLETPLNVRNSWNMMGPGLADTREKLSDKRRRNAYRFSFKSEPVLEIVLDALGLSLTEIELGWTERQSQIASRLMHNSAYSNKQLAKHLRISENTLYKVRRAARVEIYTYQWNAVEAALADLDKHYGMA